MNLALFNHPRVLPQSLYVHYPLCKHHCSYCDFNVYSQSSKFRDFGDRWVDTIQRHLDHWCEGLPLGRLQTLYWGGGTPSLLSPEQMFRLMGTIKDHFSLGQIEEFTIEANPEDISFEWLDRAKALGATRISLGVQSFLPKQLKRLERLATANKILDAIAELQRSFSNFNIDLMIGLPDQTKESLQSDLDILRGIAPPHVSIYTLTLKDDHKWRRLPAISLRLPEDERVEEFYFMACEALRGDNYVHYEVSNFSAPGFESRHNQLYWDAQSSYWGLGPGAHGYWGGCRYANRKDPYDWSEHATGLDWIEPLTDSQRSMESFYLRLRTRKPVLISEVRDAVLPELDRAGFVRLQNDAVFLTDAGWIRMESLAEALMPQSFQ